MKKENSTNSLNERYLLNTCDFNYVLQLIGGRWKSQIIFSIAHGNNRFSLIKQDLDNISDQVLGRQLRSLEIEGIIEKSEIPFSIPKGIQYNFTEKADSLIPLLRELCQWGGQHKRPLDPIKIC
ncbi:helix-turn-helix domain-containing protein [Sphingobacterium sp. HMA12]|uniref:winged helix-turn-helix transcriptional regulator n=1 Tax=Sphingobacterium sp. HMA12 TaxID=2050894 RepID=UPI000CEA311D|nr:helix-turn-helix domain-containing protein [Sphingobacterium sp. HMA12]